MNYTEEEIENIKEETYKLILDYANNKGQFYNNLKEYRLEFLNDRFYIYDIKYNSLIDFYDSFLIKQIISNTVEMHFDKKIKPNNKLWYLIDKFLDSVLSKMHPKDFLEDLSLKENDYVTYLDEKIAKFTYHLSKDHNIYLNFIKEKEDYSKRQKEELQQKALLEKQNKLLEKERMKVEKKKRKEEKSQKRLEKELKKLEESLQEKNKDLEPDINLSLKLEINQIKSITPLNNPTSTSFRNVYLSPVFKSQLERYKNCPGVYSEFIKILQIFSTFNHEDLSKFLWERTMKQFRGIEDKIYKIYIKAIQGSRLILSFGNDLTNIKYKDSIIVLKYVKDHDDQEKEARKIDLSLLNDLDKYLVNIDNLNNEPIIKYVYNPTFKFKYVLSDEQSKLVSLNAPALIKGNAGAGKTIISFEMFEKLTESNKLDTYYLTFSKYLVIYAKTYLKDSLTKDDNKIIMTSDFLIKYLNLKADNYIDYQDFKNWLHNNKEIKRLSIENVPTYILWTFIRGIIKGTYKDNINYMSLFAFKSYIINNEPKYENFSDKIYDCYKLYEKYLKTNNFYDDNDLATLLLKSNKREDFYLIIDEVQDLTERILYSLTHLVNNNYVYMFGDPNQTIQPTIIDLNSIKSMFKGTKAYDIYQKATLKTTYRNGKEILRFINYLNLMRQTYIAKSDYEDDKSFETNKVDDINLCTIKCVGDKTLNFEILSLVLRDPNTRIIVSSDETKESLVNRNSLFKNVVSTIEDVKGLEHDNIIIYNFIKDNNNLIKNILNNEGKRDTFSRTVFNRLYVAATRARNRIALLEDDTDSIVDTFYKDIPLKKTLIDVSLYLGLSNNKEDWLRNAYEYKKYFEYNSAKYSFEQINEDHKYDNEIELCKILDYVNNVVHDRTKDLSLRFEIILNECDILLESNEYQFIYESLIYLHQSGLVYPDLYYYVKMLIGKPWTNEDLINITKLKSLKYLSKNINFIYNTYVLPKLNEENKLINEIVKESEM